MYTLSELQDKINAEIDSRMQKLASEKPVGLYLPVSYSMGVGGKRLRPVLLLMAYNMFRDDVERALPAALAIETFHNFTLLHDDIMDKAEVRRNQPTVHMRFSENSAILSGDAMAFLTYQYLLECQTGQLHEIAGLITRTAIEVCEGQQLDMEFENRRDVTADEYLEMIRLKTAVLLGCSLKSGALLAGADARAANDLYNFGINLGLAFQLQDDLLDTFGNQQQFGKKIGNDILANKKTYLLIKALEKGNEKQARELNQWLDRKEYVPSEKVSAVTALYNQLNIKETAEEKISRYFTAAGEILRKLRVDDDRKARLQSLGNLMLKRDH